MRQGTIVDATIITAPPSTKNKQKVRDGRDALKDRDQHLQAPRAPRIARQDRGREADAPGIIGSATVAHAGLAHADGAVS
jgi:hypothetical protein